GSPRSHKPPRCFAARGFLKVNSILTSECPAKKWSRLENSVEVCMPVESRNAPSKHKVERKWPLVSLRKFVIFGVQNVPFWSVRTVWFKLPSRISLPFIHARTKGRNFTLSNQKVAVPVLTQTASSSSSITTATL